MTNDDKIKDVKLQYGINKKSAKFIRLIIK